MLCLGESDCGKSNACSYACIRPIRWIEKECSGTAPLLSMIILSTVYSRHLPSMTTLTYPWSLLMSTISSSRTSFTANEDVLISARCVDKHYSLLSDLYNAKRIPQRSQSKVVRSRDGMDDRFLIIFVTSQQDITVYQPMDAKNQLKASPLRELN